MKVIFLDFDGVICTARQAYAADHRGVICCLDPVALAFLERMVVKHGVEIVISSTWRLGETPRYFQELFTAAGFYRLGEALHDDWCTDHDGKIRGEEIERWLKNHPETERYLILDDDSDMLPYQKPFFVKTDCYNGMLMEHYRAAETIISGKAEQ